MKPAVHHALFALMLLSLTFFASVALADPAGVAPTLAGLSNASLVALLVCWAISYGARRLAPQGNFFHTPAGAALLSGACFLALTVSHYVESNGLSLRGVLVAVVAGVVSLGITSNPSVPTGQTAPMALKKQAGRAELLAVLFVAIVGCVGLTVWKACELGLLPQVSQTVIPTIVTDLSGVDSATAITQVENVAGGLLPGQISCIVQAITADIAAKSAATKSMLSPVEENIARNGQAYLKKHPQTACGEPPPRAVASIAASVRGRVLAGVPPVQL